MNKKSVLGIAMASILALGTMAGCGNAADTNAGDTNSGSTENGSTEGAAQEGSGGEQNVSSAYERDENGYPDLKGETITIWHAMTGANAQATSDLGDYKVIQELEQKFNCNIEFIHPPVGQEQDNFTIMMADTELPDMIFCGGIDKYYPGGVAMAYEDGILLDYTEYINEQNTPNFYKLISEDENVKKMVSDDEGRIIRLGAKFCGSKEADLSYTGLLIRSDYLEQTGMEIPTTIPEWTALFEKMKEIGVVSSGAGGKQRDGRLF